MAITLKSVLGTIGSVAPTIAKAIGGPLAGTAVGALASALGLGGDATEQEVAAVIAKATPEQLLALKQADNDFATKMRELDVEFDRIAAADRDSARKREMETKDWIPGALAIVLTLGFFGMLAFLLQAAPPEGSRDVLYIMLGSLGTGWATMLAYYFGTSSGSAEKNKTVAAAILKK